MCHFATGSPGRETESEDNLVVESHSSTVNMCHFVTGSLGSETESEDSAVVKSHS